jgi:hypothetical protein
MARRTVSRVGIRALLDFIRGELLPVCAQCKRQQNFRHTNLKFYFFHEILLKINLPW